MDYASLLDYIARNFAECEQRQTPLYKMILC